MTAGIEGVAGAAEEALIADAAASEFKPGRGRRQPGDACANCGAKLFGPHCHACGQVADDLHRPFWSLIKDGIEGLFAIDGRFFKTVPTLLFRPGRVTKSYLDGARARYVPPFRLYLVSAIIFLLAVSTVTGDWTEFDFTGPPPSPEANLEAAERRIEEQTAAARARGDESTPGLDRAAEALEEAQEELAEAREEQAAEAADADALEEDVPIEVRLARERVDAKCAWRRQMLPEELGTCPAEATEGEDDDFSPGDMDDQILTWPIEVRRFLVHQTEVVIDNPNRFLESVNAWISRVLIGLFPVYALLLAITHFWKRRFYFYDHLIVSMHLHSFIFVLTTILIGLGWLTIPWWMLMIVFFVWSNLYLYKTHRVVYGSGRFSAGFRTLVMDLLYFCVLLFVPMILVITGFLTA